MTDASRPNASARPLIILLGVALAVSAAVSDKASRDNMRDMTSRTAKRRMR